MKKEILKLLDDEITYYEKMISDCGHDGMSYNQFYSVINELKYLKEKIEEIQEKEISHIDDIPLQNHDVEKKIIVIGGSFNPPTIAHMALAQITRERVHAALVLFVPTKLSYMVEWKKYQNSDILSDDIRMQSLKTLENDWIKIERCELDGIVSGTSFDTLNYIKNKYQTQQVYFAIGSDKLEEIPRWYNSEQLLKENQFVVIQRNHDNIDKILDNNQLLRSYKDSFLICQEVSESTQEISSTKVRDEIKKQNYTKIQQMVPESVYNIIYSNIKNKHI